MRPLDGGRPLTLEVDDGRVSGSAGVNRFMGGLGSDHVFFDMATTKMAGPEELMAQEAILLAHLETVDSIERSNSGRLLLADGLIVLTLVPVS